MILYEEPKKGAGSGDADGNSKPGKGKAKTSSKTSKQKPSDDEDDDELTADMDAYGDDIEDEEDLDDEELDDEDEEIEEDEDEDIEELDPFIPPKTGSKGKTGKKSVMEDFDTGDTDFFEREFFDDDDDDDDLGIGKGFAGGKSAPKGNSGKRNLRPLGKRNDPAGDDPNASKPNNDPAGDDPKSKRKLK